MNQQIPNKNPIVTIESVDQEGRGIAHHEGKVIFIEGALIGERVIYASFRKKPSFENAQSTAILKSSFMRVQPKCVHFGVCGGCSMQHLDERGQVAVKQRILEENLKRIGKVYPETMLPPIHGSAFGYRQRARLSAKYVIKKVKRWWVFTKNAAVLLPICRAAKFCPPKFQNCCHCWRRCWKACRSANNYRK